jgi:CRP/FNR family transcriptional regulator, cyclic AMP receptor protein
MRKALYFLGILNDSDIDWLVTAGMRQEVPSGVSIIDEGRPLDSLFLVISGAFSVTVAALGARQVARLMSGEVMGEMSFVDSAPPSATVKALETSMVLAIPRRRLNARLADDSGFAGRFYRALAMFLAARLRATTLGASAGERDDELPEEAMDYIAMAGARFDWIQKRLRGA